MRYLNAECWVLLLYSGKFSRGLSFADRWTLPYNSLSSFWVKQGLYLGQSSLYGFFENFQNMCLCWHSDTSSIVGSKDVNQSDIPPQRKMAAILPHIITLVILVCMASLRTSKTLCSALIWWINLYRQLQGCQSKWRTSAKKDGSYNAAASLNSTPVELFFETS